MPDDFVRATDAAMRAFADASPAAAEVYFNSAVFAACKAFLAELGARGWLSARGMAEAERVLKKPARRVPREAAHG